MNKILTEAAAAAAENTRRAATSHSKWIKVDLSVLNPIVMIPRKNAADEYGALHSA